MMLLAYKDGKSEWTFEAEEIVSVLLSALAERGDNMDSFLQEIALRHPLTIHAFRALYEGPMFALKDSLSEVR